jgi:uncharacterized protein
MPIPTVPLIGFPLDGVDDDGRWRFSRGEPCIREALWNILLTRPGDRLMRPTFGAGIERFIHQPNNESTRSLMQSVITKAVQMLEPRIELDAVEVAADRERATAVTVALRYRIRGTGRVDGFAIGIDLSP